MQLKEKFPGIFLIDDKVFVKNYIQGYNPFGDKTVKIKNQEYIEWDPQRSKLSAAIVKGIKTVPIKEGDKILYLGLAHSYTASKLSSVIGKNGIIYGVEFSERCFQETIPISEKISNIVPILADARLPQQYDWIEKCDVVYCDIAQQDQTAVAIRNCKIFLKENGFLLLAIKARSIDVTKPPKKICEQEIEKLNQSGFEIVDWKMLDPLERDHGFVVARMK